MSKHKVLKQQLISLIMGMALVIAMVGATAGVNSTLAKLVAPEAPAIACHSTGQSGGGC